MKTINVSDEMYKALRELSKEITHQNHRHTGMPYIFQIQTQEEVSVGEGQGEEVWVCDGHVIPTQDDKEIMEVVREWHDNLSDEDFELSIKNRDIAIEDSLDSAGYYKANRDYVDRYQNAFFTEKACKEHIKRNSYHYNEPVDFLSYAYRNPEMELVMKFLCELTGGKLHR